MIIMQGASLKSVSTTRQMLTCNWVFARLLMWSLVNFSTLLMYVIPAPIQKQKMQREACIPTKKGAQQMCCC